MANKLYEESNISAIANAIRAMGVSGMFTVAQMPNAILSIPQGGSPPIAHLSKSIYSNGYQSINVTDYAYLDLTVDVPTYEPTYYACDYTDGEVYKSGTSQEVLAWVQSQSTWQTQWIVGNVIAGRAH